MLETGLLPQQHLPLLLVSWTLVYEMFFYLLFAAALRWLRSEDLLWVLAAWAAAIVVGHVALAPRPAQPVLHLIFSPLLLEFTLGCLVALYAARMGRLATVGCLIAGTAGLAAGVTALDWQGVPYPQGWPRVLIFGTSSALVVAGIVAMERNVTARYPRPLVALGDASYSLYLSHVPVIGLVGLIWHRLVSTAAPALHVAGLAAGFAVALAAGLTSFRLIELPLLRVSRRLARVATGVPIR